MSLGISHVIIHGSEKLFLVRDLKMVLLGLGQSVPLSPDGVNTVLLHLLED